MDPRQESLRARIRRAILAYATAQKLRRARRKNVEFLEELLQLTRHPLQTSNIPASFGERQRLARDLLHVIFSCATVVFSASDERRAQLARLLDETTMA